MDCLDGQRIAEIRADFPILKQKMRGKPFVYFDNAATSLKPQSVIDKEVEYYTTMGANIHRGVYEFSERATLAYDETREKVARFINAPADGRVIFTRGATESINLVAQGLGRKLLKAGDEIVTTEIEHHADLIPWQELAREREAVLKFIPVDPKNGSIDLDDVRKAVGSRTKIVAVTAMSNVTGYMPPVKEITKIAHDAGALVVVDGAQFVSHHPVDVQDIGCDFLAFSSHKMLGPTGVGVLYGREEALDRITPGIFGGDMIIRVWKDRATYQGLPERLEAGTPNIAGVIAFAAAIDYLTAVGMEAVARHESELVSYAIELTRDLPDLTIYTAGDPSRQGGIFSFNVNDIHSHDTGSVLDNEGIAVRTGFHCAQPYMRLLGIPGTVRASFYLYNTKEEIDKLVYALGKVREVFA